MANMNIKDFADSLGISTATVSRAIHGSGRVSAATRERVLKSMDELGFTPNLHAQQLVRGRSGMVGLAFPEQGKVLADLFFAALAHAMQQELQDNNLGLMLNLMEQEDAQENLLKKWASSQAVDALVLVTGTPSASLLSRLPQVPTVVIGHSPCYQFPHVACVVLDLEQGIRSVARLFVEHGHSSIGYIGNTDDSALAVFRTSLADAGIILKACNVAASGSHPSEGSMAAMRLLQQANRPTAIFARTDMIAMGIFHAASALNLAIPGDLSVAGHDDIDLASWTAPPLSTVQINYRSIASHTVALIKRLLSDHHQLEPVHISTSLVVRETIGSSSTAA